MTELLNYAVSIVMIQDRQNGIRIQNKIYSISAVSEFEAHGKAVELALKEYPGHSLHTICSIEI